jgi:hypothetical protein
MSARTRVVQVLSEKVGFQFDESQLPPSLRQKIGDLAGTRKQLDDKVFQLNAHWQQSQTLTTLAKSTKTRSLITLIIGGILFAFGALGVLVESFISPVGVIFYGILFVSPGFVLLLYGVFRWNTSHQSTLKVQTANYDVTILNADIAKLNASYIPQLTALSQQILSELSSLHEGRLHLSTATQSPQIVKETVLKEVVMIPCPYCKGLMPQTSVYCLHCGAQRRA